MSVSDIFRETFSAVTVNKARSGLTILGIVIFVGTFGGATGLFLAGKMFDVSGTYLQSFLICAILAVTAFVVMLLLKPIGKQA